MLLQRIFLFILGAAIGGFALLAVGEWIRPIPSAIAQSTNNTEQPMADKPDVVIQGPGSAYSSGQKGGITAGTYINQAPPPELKLLNSTDTQNPDGTHTRVIRLVVIAPYAPGQLTLSAEAPGIIDIDINPLDAGTVQFGSPPRTPNSAALIIQSPTGRYDFTVKTTKHEIINLTYAFK